MKPKNFPARKKARQIKAQLGRHATSAELADARKVRTKKDRSGRAKLR